MPIRIVLPFQVRLVRRHGSDSSDELELVHGNTAFPRFTVIPAAPTHLSQFDLSDEQKERVLERLQEVVDAESIQAVVTELVRVKVVRDETGLVGS